MSESATGTVILGLGNLVRGDDGVGVHAIRLLERDARISPQILLLDGGTHGLSLIPHISGFRRILVIDAVDVGERPGTIVRLEEDALKGLPGKASVHSLGFADLMVALELLGEPPDDLVVLGVQPSLTEWSTQLTTAVSEALHRIPDLVIEQLERWQTQPAVTAA
jgi:hydrogenase maturation protease